MYNQFLGGMGPRPANAQPMLEDPNSGINEWAAQNSEQEDAVRLGIEDLISQQIAGTRQEQLGLAPKVAGMALKDTYPQFGQAIRGAVDYAVAPLKQGVRAAQNYVTGGTTTTGPTTLGAVFDAAGQYAGAAGTAYNTYKNLERGFGNARSLEQMLRADPYMSRHDRAKYTQQSIDQGFDDSETGAATGAVSGLAAGGPAGAVAGAVLGSAGGQAQAVRGAAGAPGSDWKAYGRGYLHNKTNDHMDWVDHAKELAKVGKNIF